TTVCPASRSGTSHAYASSRTAPSSLFSRWASWRERSARLVLSRSVFTRPDLMTVVPASTPRASARNTATMVTRWYRNEITARSFEPLRAGSEDPPELVEQLVEEQSERLRREGHHDHREQGRPHEQRDVAAA